MSSNNKQAKAKTNPVLTNNFKNCFSNFHSKYFSMKLPIQIRFFNIIFVCGFLAGISGIIACLFLGSSRLAITIATIFTFYMPVMFIISNRSAEHLNTTIIVSFCILDFIILPMMYITGGGIDCGIPSYFIIGIALTMFIVKGKLGIVLSVLDAIFCVVVIAISHYCNHFVIELPEESIFMAIFSNALMVEIALAFMSKSVFRQFYLEKNSANKLAEELKDMSFKDPLTSTYNRRFMMDFLQTEMRKSWESKQNLSIIMIDIDKFKRLNDNYGHLVGDEVLVNLSFLLMSMCRESDIVARYGGEEFLLILPNTTKEIAAKRAESIRKMVQDTPLSESLLEEVTISLGVGEYNKGLSCEKFVDIADDNLYKAKNTGRNRVCAD